MYLNASILGLSRAGDRRGVRRRSSSSPSSSDFIDTQVKFYSSGMYVRLGFAVAVHVDPHILLVDEVLAVGDDRRSSGSAWPRSRRSRQEGRTIVFVTHSPDLVLQICDSVVLLEKGRMVTQGDPAGHRARLPAR